LGIKSEAGSNIELISASPVANETYLNVGLLNSRIAAMQNKINELEAEVKASKK
jgi:thiosulfate/3-mercaptopyruvate sulfurtransferase